MVANYFKNNNIDAKVVILDPRDKPITKAKGFLQAYSEYGKFIEYIPNATIQKIDLDTKSIDIQIFDKAAFKMQNRSIEYNFANIIPQNRAGAMIDLAGIEQVRGGWAKLKDPSFQSVSDERIFVVGDAINSPYPKSAHIANSCGAIAAHEIVARVANRPYDFTKTPSNMCFSMVQTNPKKGIVVLHWVEFKNDEIVVHTTQSNEIKKETGQSIIQWYDGIVGDIFA